MTMATESLLLFSKAGSAIKLEAVHAHSAGAGVGYCYKTVFLRRFWINALNPKLALTQSPNA